jgi:hypothetical protein
MSEGGFVTGLREANLIKPMKLKLFFCALSVLLLATVAVMADGSESETGFVSLFDGKTLDGWKVGENANLFHARDGMIQMECPPTIHGSAHLFYVGEVSGHTFKNFDLKVDVMTFPYANSGIYFHTQFQESGWPNHGLECQVNNSHSDWRRTGSLWGVKNISWGPELPPADNQEPVEILDKPAVMDNTWYTQEVIYQNGAVTVKLDGKTVLEYTIPEADTEHKLPTGNTWMPQGTFALQGHPPLPGKASKAWFKNIRVKVLPD